MTKSEAELRQRYLNLAEDFRAMARKYNRQAEKWELAAKELGDEKVR